MRFWHTQILAYTNADIYHESKIAKPLNKTVEKKMLNPNQTAQIIQKFNGHKTQDQKKKLLKDPNINKIQKALESSKPKEIHSLLESLEQ